MTPRRLALGILLTLTTTAGAFADNTPTPVFTGVVATVTKTDLAIRSDDGGNVISFSILHKTRFVKDGKKVDRSAVHPGDAVTVEASEDPTGHPSAITVTIGKPLRQ
jgi:hypothetical protein